jgi:hypothetical protein
VLNSDFSLETIRFHNALFSANNYDGTANFPNNTFTIDSDAQNCTRALISAPHAVRHSRDGNERVPELHTGGMATILGLMAENEAKAFVVTNVYNDPNEPRDPNYDPLSSCTYTQEIVELINRYDIKFVLDIHGAAASRPFDIAIGTNHDETIGQRADIRALIFEVNDRHGFSIDYNETFPATNSNTVTRKVYDETGVYAIQVEINGRYRLVGDASVDDYNRMMDFLKDLIASLDNLLAYQEATVNHDETDWIRYTDRVQV